MAERNLRNRGITFLNRESGIEIYNEPSGSRETISNNIRKVSGDDTDGIEQYKVSDFTKNGVITLTRNYPENSVDIDAYDLSTIQVIKNDDVNFNFILSILDGLNSEPTLYTSDKFYKELVDSYDETSPKFNPAFTNNAINERNIVVVDIKPIKERFEKLRQAELDIDIIATDSENKDKVEVIKNVFYFSNYEVDDTGKLIANPTYDILDLLKYINWVVSKPAQSYDDRLLSPQIIGNWNRIQTPIEELTDEEEPSVNRSNRDRTSTIYEPVGRRGRVDEEEFIYAGDVYVWIEDESKWKKTSND